MSVTLEHIKALREQTGAGMVDVKKALDETGGDMTAAAELLRKRGIAKAAKRADREASEGIILADVSSSGTTGYMVEVNSETDFVARNDRFLAFANKVFDLVKEKQPASREELLQLEVDGETLQTQMDALTGSIGEKIDIKNVAVVSQSDGVVASYIHAGGRIGVLVALKGLSKGNEIARDIAMQIAAANPKHLTPQEVATAEVEKEKEIYREQLAQEGKPAEMIEKIIAGKLSKYFEEVCLLKQAFIKDDKKSVEQVLKEAGENVTVEKFVRFALS